MTYEIHIVGTEVRFGCAADQNILEAALQAGIELPYSCRKGVCGNCAGGISAEQVQSPPGTDGRDEDHLYCQCFPRSDLSIAPQAWHRADPTARKTFQVKVFRNTLAAPDVSILQLRLAVGQRAKFKAGQYLQLTLARREPALLLDGQRATRERCPAAAHPSRDRRCLLGNRT